MKPLHVSILFLSVFMSISAIAQSSSTNGTLGPMTETLKKKSMAGFLKDVNTNSWMAPHIPSAWLINERRAGEDAKPARDCGLAVLKMVDEKAGHRFNEDPRKSYAEVEDFITLASWLQRGGGFWNLVLCSRIADVVCVEIGYLAVDPESDVKQLRSSLSRIDAVLSNDVMVARALNEELGETFFEEEWTAKYMLTVWTDYSARLMMERLEKQPQVIKGEMLTMLREQKAKRPLVEKKVQKPEFFEEPEGEVPWTTARAWDRRCHKLLLLRYRPASMRRVADLLTFREKVGSFPVHPTIRRYPQWEEGKDAFREAWEPYRKPEQGALWAGAWTVFEQVSKGTFTDFDTLLAASRRAKGEAKEEE